MEAIVPEASASTSLQDLADQISELAGHLNAADRRWLIYTIKNQHNNKQKVAEVIDFVWNSGGIQYAQEAMHRYRKEALALLAQFPQGEGRTGLEQLIWFTIERKK